MLNRIGSAGTLESNDIYISVAEMPAGSGVQLELTSIVYPQFGREIQRTLLAVAHAFNLTDLHITAVDKGALTCTIQARMETALSRAGLR